jgi:hypothetical protein
MRVRARPAARRGIDEDDADADAAVVGADELGGDVAERQVGLLEELDVHQRVVPDASRAADSGSCDGR